MRAEPTPRNQSLVTEIPGSHLLLAPTSEPCENTALPSAWSLASRPPTTRLWYCHGSLS